MTDNTPLPEQGGFNEKFSKIIGRVYLFGLNGGLGYNKFDDELSPAEAKDAIRTLVLEEIICGDTKVSIKTGVDPESMWHKGVAFGENSVRIDQRKKLEDISEQ